MTPLPTPPEVSSWAPRHDWSAAGSADWLRLARSARHLVLADFAVDAHRRGVAIAPR